MRPGRGINWLAIFSGVSLLAAILLLVVEMVFYSRSFSTLSLTVTEANFGAVELYLKLGFDTRRKFDAFVWEG